MLASTTRSPPTATQFIRPGGNSPILATATNPSGMAARFPPRVALAGRDWVERAGRLIRAEAEQLRGVAGSDLAPVFFRDAGEDAVEKLLRLRPGRFGMREIAAPEHV